MNVLVIGKSKTGTTVISKTIARSLPGETMFLFEPTDVAAFTQEHDKQNTVIKVLFDQWLDKKRQLSTIANNNSQMQFDKLVLIRRDPRDEVISVLLYYPFDMKRVVKDQGLFDAWIELLQEKERTPASISFMHMCETFDSLFNMNYTKSLSKFSSFDYGFYHFCTRIWHHHLLLRYEDFITENTQGLAQYLNLELSKERDVGASYKQTYRTGSCNNWKRYFTEEDITYFKQFSDTFSLLGYDDWELAPADHIPERELSGYVRMLLEK